MFRNSVSKTETLTGIPYGDGGIEGTRDFAGLFFTNCFANSKNCKIEEFPQYNQLINRMRSSEATRRACRFADGSTG